MVILAKILGVILGILMCSAGAHFVAAPGATITAVAIVVPITIGSVLLVSSIIRFVHWTQKKSAGGHDGLLFWESILGIILGGTLLLDETVQSVAQVMSWMTLPLWAGITILTNGIFRIAYGIRARQFNEAVAEIGSFQINWVLEIVLGVLIVIVGIASLCYPLITMNAMGIVFGIDVIITGITMIISSLALS